MGAPCFPEKGQVTQSQMQGYMAQAGWPGDLIPLGSAIFMSESCGGCIYAKRNAPPVEISIGLSQVNILAWTQYSENELYDPVTNLRAAYHVYTASKRGFSPWGSFTNGRYKTYYGGGQIVPVGNVMPGTQQSAAAGGIGLSTVILLLLAYSAFSD